MVLPVLYEMLGSARPAKAADEVAAPDLSGQVQAA
jgi:hypothetical protein